MSSSPADPPAPVELGEPVELMLIGRTLRGTLGEAFRREALAAFESRHGADAPPPDSSVSRTVELTTVAVTRAGTVSVDTGIADPAFRSVAGSHRPGVGERVFEVAVDEVDGIGPIAGPPGVDLTRWAVVRVRPDDPGTSLAFRVSVLPPPQ